MAGAGAASAAAQPVSTYSRHDWTTCRFERAIEPDVVLQHRCDPVRGIAITLVTEPDSAVVLFGANPLREATALGGFHTPGDTIEWRGPAGGPPQAAILRYRTGRSVRVMDRSVLVIHRLQPDGASCFLGQVDGAIPNANARARALADERAAGFACGRDEQIVVGR